MTFASACVQPAGTVSLLVPIALCCSMAQQQKEDAKSPLGKMFNILYKLSSLLPCFPIKSWSEVWAVCFAPFKFLSQNFMLKKTHTQQRLCRFFAAEFAIEIVDVCPSVCWWPKYKRQKIEHVVLSLLLLHTADKTSWLHNVALKSKTLCHSSCHDKTL